VARAAEIDGNDRPRPGKIHNVKQPGRPSRILAHGSAAHISDQMMLGSRS